MIPRWVNIVADEADSDPLPAPRMVHNRQDALGNQRVYSFPRLPPIQNLLVQTWAESAIQTHSFGEVFQAGQVRLPAEGNLRIDVNVERNGWSW